MVFCLSAQRVFQAAAQQDLQKNTTPRNEKEIIITTHSGTKKRLANNTPIAKIVVHTTKYFLIYFYFSLATMLILAIQKNRREKL